MSRLKISSPPNDDEIRAVFEYYAGAYELMERIQKPDPQPDAHERLLPTGDQKTGCIGEYWAMRYARRQFKTHKCHFGHHSQQGWDIAVQGTSTRIQVKTVSHFASPWHTGRLIE